MSKYSQKNEEEYILKYFKDFTGRFLDIGAYDGITGSNTRALYEKGWSGVCVEPSPSALLKLKELYLNEERIKILPVAVRVYGGVGVTNSFHECENDQCSSFNYEHISFWRSEGRRFKKVEVKVLNFETLFSQVGTDFSFINIDVEGENLELFLTLPFKDLPKLKCVCVEHQNKFTQFIQRFLLCGFNKYVCVGDNLIAMKSEEN